MWAPRGTNEWCIRFQIASVCLVTCVILCAQCVLILRLFTVFLQLCQANNFNFPSELSSYSEVPGINYLSKQQRFAHVSTFSGISGPEPARLIAVSSLSLSAVVAVERNARVWTRFALSRVKRSRRFACAESEFISRNGRSTERS